MNEECTTNWSAVLYLSTTYRVPHLWSGVAPKSAIVHVTMIIKKVIIVVNRLYFIPYSTLVYEYL